MGRLVANKPAFKQVQDPTHSTGSRRVSIDLKSPRYAARE
jgi:hypothetical protein